jgi:hypothetical protein
VIILVPSGKVDIGAAKLGEIILITKWIFNYE